MELKVVSAVVAAAVAGFAVTGAASANRTPVGNDKASTLSADTDTWINTVFSSGTENGFADVTDNGIDLSEIGGVIMSWHDSEFSETGGTKDKEMHDKYNWVQTEFRGITDEDIPGSDPDYSSVLVEWAYPDKPSKFTKCAVLSDNDGRAMLAFNSAENVSPITQDDSYNEDTENPELSVSDSDNDQSISNDEIGGENQENPEKQSFPQWAVWCIAVGASLVAAAIIAAFTGKKK